MAKRAKEKEKKKEIDHHEPSLHRRDVLLGLAAFAGPVAWALHLQVSYSLAPTACDMQSKIFLHLATLGCLLLAGAGALVGRRYWKELPEGSTEKGEVELSRARFMALASTVLSLAFALVIVAAEVPNWILRVCD
ncbi:MAG TPA: hypothetical protein VE685_23830 [Thermoanaerobaculia bacterium]|nr:hypothetical protein [Thermoanaerobaculia bacterium]